MLKFEHRLWYNKWTIGCHIGHSYSFDCQFMHILFWWGNLTLKPMFVMFLCQRLRKVPTGAASDSSHTSTHMKTTTPTIIQSRQHGFKTMMCHAIQWVKVFITSNITYKLRKFRLTHVFINDAITKIGWTCQSSACRKNHQFQVDFAQFLKIVPEHPCYHSTFWSQIDVGKSIGLPAVQLLRQTELLPDSEHMVVVTGRCLHVGTDRCRQQRYAKLAMNACTGCQATPIFLYFPIISYILDPFL